MNDEFNNNREVEEHEGPIGPIVGSVIVIVIIVIGGLYFWGKAIDEGLDNNLTAEEIRNEEDPQKAELEAQSNSDEIDAIEEDLDNSNFDNLDKEFDQIDEEIN